MNRLMKKIYILTLVFIALFSVKAFAKPFTLCNGKEFNQRVKSFLNGNDKKATMDYSITIFERGYNVPNDKAYYVDVSEDNDGSVLVYSVDNVLYWYSMLHTVSMNQNSAFMFDHFMRMRNIDLSGFSYMDGLGDTRYMFCECRNLKTIKFKSGTASSTFAPSEMQGMFFSCQSLQSIDLSLFETYHVDNMDEVFFKCYNLKNIYVNKDRWNIESVRTFNRIFSQCHLLRTNKGRKAVDIAEDGYERYAIPGDEKNEGFLKDINTTYSDYGEYLDAVPIDGINYIVEMPETIQLYSEEPEGDGSGNGAGDGSGNGIGSGTGTGTPYVGNKASGYNSEKEQQKSDAVITPTNEANPISQGSGITNESTLQSQVAIESSINVETENVTVSSTDISSAQVEIADTTVENIITEDITNEIVETEANEIDGRKVIELDEYLKGDGGGKGDGNGSGMGFESSEFLIFALIISIIAILLLIGMVIYLFKDKKENKGDDAKGRI